MPLIGYQEQHFTLKYRCATKVTAALIYEAVVFLIYLCNYKLKSDPHFTRACSYMHSEISSAMYKKRRETEE